MNIMDLKKLAKEVTAKGLPFMEGRENSELAMGEIVNINEIGYLDSKDGEYVVFTTKENEECFYYGGSVVTEKIKELENKLSPKDFDTLLEEGLEVVFTSHVSSNKKRYTSVTFFPSI